MPPVTLSDLRLDEETWGGGSPERRHEWRLALSEIVQEGAFDPVVPVEGSLAGLVVVQPRAVAVEVRATGDTPLAQELMPLDRLGRLVDEYVRTCIEMSKLGVGARSPRLEALDIAKRLTHDEAGEEIVACFRTLRPDHPTGRRFFTLLVTLLHDTTRLEQLVHARGG